MISIISESVWIIKDPARTFRFQRVQDVALCFSPLGNTNLAVPQQLKPQLQRQGEGAWQAHPSPQRSEALPIGSCLPRRSAGTPLWNHDAKPPLAANFSMRAVCVFTGGKVPLYKEGNGSTLHIWVANWVVTKHLCHTKDIVFFKLCSFSFSLVIYMCF